MKYIDIHGHYAWNIDDGMPSKEDAIKALDKAKNIGIVGIAATPHLVCGKHNGDDVLRFKARIEELAQIGKEKDIAIFHGAELFLNDEYMSQLKNEWLIPYEGTHTLLCEFDVRKNHHSDDEFEERLYEVSHAGYKVLIAHIERYFRGGIDIERVENLVDNGYMIQVNSTSFLGVHGKTMQENAYELLRHNLIHCIATDTHRAQSERSPNLDKVYQLLKKEISEDDLDILMYRNPMHILKDENVETTHYVKKGLFSNLMKRRKR
ncbi:MAG: capsular biosynthesis protein [Erysipelotrichaceae bacterium]|nr:capsular biosynthesis protein [Erysipelotrichaceae bacterium]